MINNMDNSNVQTAESQSSITPKTAIELLKKGNHRFVANQAMQRDILMQVAQTGTGQYPFAAVLGCIDSRVPAEYVFDQGIGDIFNARIAGNFVNTDILGSLEFACKVAGSKLIVVLGHSSCGAVKGACDHVELGNMTHMLGNLQPALDTITSDYEDKSSNNAAYVHEVAERNVFLNVSKIKSDSPVLNELYENGEIDIVGAMYDVQTGVVSFL
tara:strand:- start:1578 stop:2219 length:642 start_codon:yes stop_codon:yes gene_type:complete